MIGSCSRVQEQPIACPETLTLATLDTSVSVVEHPKRAVVQGGHCSSQLKKNAVRAPWRYVGVKASRVIQLLVNHVNAPALKRGYSPREIRDLQRDVMHTLAPALEEFRDEALGIDRFQQLDRKASKIEDREAKAPVSTLVERAEGRAQGSFEETPRALDAIDSDTDMIESSDRLL
jgi:hypothetical protein